MLMNYYSMMCKIISLCLATGNSTTKSLIISDERYKGLKAQITALIFKALRTWVIFIIDGICSVKKDIFKIIFLLFLTHLKMSLGCPPKHILAHLIKNKLKYSLTEQTYHHTVIPPLPY